MIGHLYLIDFTLFRHIKENGHEPEIGLEVCLCVGKVLGTPRHPLINDYLPSSVPFLFAKPRFVDFNYVQMSQIWSCNIPRMANAI